MNLHKMFHLCGFLELSKGYLNDKIHCASFMTETKLVPVVASYKTTLTFSVLSTCGSDVKSVKVFRGDIHQFSQPTCNVRYKDGNCDVAMGCTCNRHSNNVSVNRNVDENLKDEVWILEGELADGGMFNKTVAFHVESMPQAHFPLVTIVAGSAGAAVIIALVIFVNVYCLRKNDRASPTSRQSARGCPGRQLPQPPTPPRAQDAGQQKVQHEPSGHVTPDSSHVNVDVDSDYIKTKAAATRAALKPKIGINVDNYLHPVSSATDKTRSPLCDDDGYLLPDHPPARETEKRDAKPSHADSTV